VRERIEPVIIIICADGMRWLSVKNPEQSGRMDGSYFEYCHAGMNAQTHVSFIRSWIYVSRYTAGKRIVQNCGVSRETGFVGDAGQTQLCDVDGTVLVDEDIALL
jgi:hypothetical protein